MQGYPSAGEVLAAHHAVFDAAVGSGAVRPCSPAHAALGPLSLFAYLMLPRHSLTSSLAFRRLYGVLLVANLAVLATALKVPTDISGNGIGIVNMLALLGYFTFVLNHDAKAEYLRVQRVEKKAGKSTAVVYKWQPFPQHSLSARYFWVLDLLLNTRGVGWNWQTGDVPGMPEHILAQLEPRHLKPTHRQPSVSRTRHRRFTSRPQFFQNYTRILVTRTVISCLFMIVMAADPYFVGFFSAPPPYLHVVQACAPASTHWLVIRFLRSLTFVFETIVPLQAFNAAKSLICVALGPSVLGTAGEEWMHPTLSGPISSLAQYGLAGFWSGYWHQMFRNVLSGTADGVVEAAGLTGKRTFVAKITTALAVFSASGLLHAVGSQMVFTRSHPWTGTFLFFWLQTWGIMLESAWRQAWRASGLSALTPTVVAQTANLMWVLLWVTLVGPILFEDEVDAGLFLYFVKDFYGVWDLIFK